MQLFFMNHRVFLFQVQFFLPCHCYAGLVHLTRYFVFGISGFYNIYISFCSWSLGILSPFCMRKTIIIAQLLTCEYERINKNDQLIFVSFNCLTKWFFGENFGSVFQFSDASLGPCKIRAIYDTRIGGTKTPLFTEPWWYFIRNTVQNAWNLLRNRYGRVK